MSRGCNKTYPCTIQQLDISMNRQIFDMICIVWHITPHSTAQHSTAQRYTSQHSTAWLSRVIVAHRQSGMRHHKARAQLLANLFGAIDISGNMCDIITRLCSAGCPKLDSFLPHRVPLRVPILQWYDTAEHDVNTRQHLHKGFKLLR